MSVADELREWLEGRDAIHELARAWPPGCKVTSHEDTPLACPAPGIVGRVVSYFESGNIGVLAPMRWTGVRFQGECDPAQLVFLEEGEITRADVEKALGS